MDHVPVTNRGARLSLRVNAAGLTETSLCGNLGATAYRQHLFHQSVCGWAPLGWQRGRFAVTLVKPHNDSIRFTTSNSQSRNRNWRQSVVVLQAVHVSLPFLEQVWIKLFVICSFLETVSSSFQFISVPVPPILGLCASGWIREFYYGNGFCCPFLS